MAAFGHSAGQRNARAFNFAKNILDKKLSPAEIYRIDHALLGAISILWHIAESILPADIINEFQKALDTSGMPGIFSSSIREEGK